MGQHHQWRVLEQQQHEEQARKNPSAMHSGLQVSRPAAGVHGEGIEHIVGHLTQHKQQSLRDGNDSAAAHLEEHGRRGRRVVLVGGVGQRDEGHGDGQREGLRAVQVLRRHTTHTIPHHTMIREEKRREEQRCIHTQIHIHTEHCNAMRCAALRCLPHGPVADDELGPRGHDLVLRVQLLPSRSHQKLHVQP